MVGQISFKGLSSAADYILLDICGLSSTEALEKYLYYYNKQMELYKKENPIPVILHGDWTKKGFSENNICTRTEDYIRIVKTLKEHTDILGFTLHPPNRKKVAWKDFIKCRDILNTEVPVFVENRSSSKLYLSTSHEIIEFCDNNSMTIDIPQLFISCKFDVQELKNTLNSLNHTNIKEIHLANVSKTEKNTFVGRSLFDGVIPMKDIADDWWANKYISLEILGGAKVFEQNKKHIPFCK